MGSLTIPARIDADFDSEARLAARTCGRASVQCSMHVRMWFPQLSAPQPVTQALVSSFSICSEMERAGPIEPVWTGSCTDPRLLSRPLVCTCRFRPDKFQFSSGEFHNVRQTETRPEVRRLPALHHGNQTPMRTETQKRSGADGSYYSAMCLCLGPGRPFP